MIASKENADSLDRVTRAQAGDDRARNELAKIALDAIRQMARSFRVSGDDLDDLVSAALAIVPKVIDRFNPAGGATFETYVKQCARNAVLDELARAKAAGPLSVGRSAARRRAELSQTERRLTAELGRCPSIEEISARSGYTVARVEALLTPMRAVALAENVTSDEGAQTEDEILDRIDAPHTAAPDSIRKWLAQAIDDLPPRQREAVTLHCGMGGAGALPISDVARCMGLTPRHVRRLIAASADALKGRIAQA